ncbi:hypothetical protein CRG98_022046 [Punica granatum]|uniref:Uncharacterized protein n=1 Tax=Punica granatum TaxID=22663 RepID=A0A2I0JMR8_PUNGR|nr:hypothetical protein CRG98_022046 [Punica granatum]
MNIVCPAQKTLILGTCTDSTTVSTIQRLHNYSVTSLSANQSYLNPQKQSKYDGIKEDYRQLFPTSTTARSPSLAFLASPTLPQLRQRPKTTTEDRTNRRDVELGFPSFPPRIQLCLLFRVLVWPSRPSMGRAELSEASTSSTDFVSGVHGYRVYPKSVGTWVWVARIENRVGSGY